MDMSESWMLAECDVRTSDLEVWAFRVRSVELNRYPLWVLQQHLRLRMCRAAA